MSAPLNLCSSELRDLGNALDALTKIRDDYSVNVTAWGAIEISIGDSAVRIEWDEAREEYVVADRNGS